MGMPGYTTLRGMSAPAPDYAHSVTFQGARITTSSHSGAVFVPGKMRRAQKCDNCGAPLNANRCDYCGTNYS